MLPFIFAYNIIINMKNYQTNKNFLVVGCGGLGCFIVEGLLRMKVNSITVCDPDKFDETNLNRQLYATYNTLNNYKVDAASVRAKELKYEGKFISYNTLFNETMLEGIDIVIDALDSIKDRLILEDLCSKRNIPLIHGAVEGNTYQVGVSMPGSNLLHNIYKNIEEPKEKHTNFVTVEACANKQLYLALSEPKEYFEVYEFD